MDAGFTLCLLCPWSWGHGASVWAHRVIPESYWNGIALAWNCISGCEGWRMLKVSKHYSNCQHPGPWPLYCPNFNSNWLIGLCNSDPTLVIQNQILNCQGYITKFSLNQDYTYASNFSIYGWRQCMPVRGTLWNHLWDGPKEHQNLPRICNITKHSHQYKQILIGASQIDATMSELLAPQFPSWVIDCLGELPFSGIAPSACDNIWDDNTLAHDYRRTQPHPNAASATFHCSRDDTTIDKVADDGKCSQGLVAEHLFI